MYMHTHTLHIYYTYIWPRANSGLRDSSFGQFSKVRSGKTGPAPWRSELSKGVLK